MSVVVRRRRPVRQVRLDRGGKLRGIHRLKPDVARTVELGLLTHIDQLHTIAEPVVGSFVTADPTTTEPWATLLKENSAGRGSFAAPLLVMQGLKDELVRPADTEGYVALARSLGIDVTYRTVAAATHGTIAYLSLGDLVAFLDRVGV